ncbi:hypothetical protein [Ruegeria lacuscaerulensis]|uniref:hypothetical protein n=1 Tax=Ruegeria lacuscaerulensis TaxID=55218 RepID=UPI00147A1201|nr:hypothetical protein [Ruegeria lacuscaerulensis]
MTSGEQTCAIEENLASWGTINFEEDTAGLAVYANNSNGQVTAARIYADNPVNPFSKPGWVHRNWSKIFYCIAKGGASTPFEPTADSMPQEIKMQLLFQNATEAQSGMPRGSEQ